MVASCVLALPISPDRPSWTHHSCPAPTVRNAEKCAPNSCPWQWGSEKGIWRLPGDGIYSTAVGYCAGYTPNPTYEEACSGMTGHTEAVQVVYDPQKISFVDILRWFWEAHDPASGMGQGNDRGTQCALTSANRAQHGALPRCWQ
jgi:methionine-S-sulfoxide reductase